MPNHTTNEVEISGNKKTIAKVVKLMTTKHEGSEFEDVTFSKIIPSPDWDTTPNENGELPTEVEEIKNKEGDVVMSVKRFPCGKTDDRWYRWNIDNWGTKWDAYNTDIHDYGSSVVMSFQTAWAPPENVAKELRRRFNSIDIQWMYNQEEDPHYQWQDLMNEI
tara:strand:+ start:975 stop:1463 length:489 start_codon:yes stop_codon:yes gene_type:complete